MAVDLSKLSNSDVENAIINGGFTDAYVTKSKFVKKTSSGYMYKVTIDDSTNDEIIEANVFIYVGKEGIEADF